MLFLQIQYVVNELNLFSSKQRIKCPAQTNNAVPPVMLEPATPGSQETTNAWLRSIKQLALVKCEKIASFFENLILVCHQY